MKGNYSLPVPPPVSTPDSFVPSGLYLGAPQISVDNWKSDEKGNFSVDKGVFKFNLQGSDLGSLVLDISVKGKPLPIRTVSTIYRPQRPSESQVDYQNNAQLSVLYGQLKNHWEK
jgi:hypothetical protein